MCTDSIEIVTFNTGTYHPHVSNLRLLEQTMAGADSYEPVTMATMTTPPGAHKKQSSLVFEVDIEFDVPKANFVLKIRVGHKKLVLPQSCVTTASVSRYSTLVKLVHYTLSKF